MSDPFVVAVVIMVFRGDRVLAMRRSPAKDVGAGLWEALSGRVDHGEQPLEAARRETREESGLEVVFDARPVVAYQAMRGDRPMVAVAYRARHVSGEVVRSEEHDRHAWLTPDEFAATTTLEVLAGVVRDAALRVEAVAAVREAAEQLGYRCAGTVDSRLKGPRGNQETFLHLRPRAADVPGQGVGR